MKELLNSRWNFILYEKEEKLLLSVVCGSVGLFDRNIYLTEEEESHFKLDGVSYIEKLAKDIRTDPSKYEIRHVKIN